MSTYSTVIALLWAFVLAGCGGGGGGGGTDDNSPLAFISWYGSVNGSIVLDATNEPVRFRVDNRRMVSGGVTAMNVRVGAYGRLYIYDVHSGYVRKATGALGNMIMALVDLEGFYLDVVGTFINPTTRRPTPWSDSKLQQPGMLGLGQGVEPADATSDVAYEPII